MGSCCRINWYIRCSTRRPNPRASTSLPHAGTRRLPIDNHLEPYGSLTSRRAHHEMDIAGVELARDPLVGLVPNDSLRPDRPVSRKRPAMTLQRTRTRVQVMLVPR